MFKNLIKKTSDKTVDHPWLVISFFIIITIISLLQLQNIEIDTAIKSLIPADMPSRIRIEEIEAVFGGTDMVMITVQADDVLNAEVLQKIKYISDNLQKVREIDKVNSPFTLNNIEGKNNELIIEAAVPDIPESEAEKEELRSNLLNNELVIANVISKDFKAVSIGAVLSEGAEDAVVLNKIDNIISQAKEEYNSSSKIAAVGLPIIRALNAEIMQQDMSRLLPLGLIIMLIFLFLCFKQLRGVFLPFAVVIMSIIFSLSLIPVMGWKFQLPTIILPVILIAVTNDYGIHIIAAYQELVSEKSKQKEIDNKSDITAKKLISSQTIKNLGLPIAATAITTMIGLLALLSHIVTPVKELGFLAAAGIAFSFFASILFIPAVLSLLKLKTPLNEKQKNKGLEKLLRKTAAFVSSNPKKIIIISFLSILLIASGIRFLEVDTNPISFYSDDSDIVQTTELVNRKFGGANPISILAEGNLFNPEVMQKISDFEYRLEEYKDIGEVTAISKIMREMNQELHNNNPEFNKIPDSQNALAQYFLLFSMSGDLDKLVDFNRENALITARIPSNSTKKISKTVEYIKEQAAAYPDSIFKTVGGFADLLAELESAIVWGQIYSLFISIILVGIVIMFLFKSITAGIYTIIPLGAAVTALFGLMGFFKIELNIITAMLSSIMIGIGVDYTIHFIWRYKKERPKMSAQEAVLKTLTTSGRGIIFNALSVIVGFSVLLISGFMAVQFFAFLVTVSIGTCLIGALVLLPSLVLVFQPKFLEKNSD
jgi:hypothetical protein